MNSGGELEQAGGAEHGGQHPLGLLRGEIEILDAHERPGFHQLPQGNRVLRVAEPNHPRPCAKSEKGAACLYEWKPRKISYTPARMVLSVHTICCNQPYPAWVSGHGALRA